MIWLGDNRLLFSRDEPDSGSSNVWSLPVDLRSGRGMAAPARVTSAPGFVNQFSVTADGRRLVLLRGEAEADVYVAPFSASAPRPLTPRRLTLDDANDYPFDWTPDSKAVLFISDRNGTRNIYRQEIDKTTAEMLSVGPENKVLCRLSPDGTQLLYTTATPASSAPVTLLRIALKGGPTQRLLEASGLNNFQCSRSPATVCAMSQQEKNGLILSRFDPLSGKSTPIQTLESGGIYNWSLTPDGTQIAVVNVNAGGRIKLLPISGVAGRTLEIKNWSGFISVDWAADSKSLFISSNPGGRQSTLLNVSLQGAVHPLWQVTTNGSSWAIPSRDGRHLAIGAPSVEINAWMLEHF
jgi:Tol biopolymer transport system component